MISLLRKSELTVCQCGQAWDNVCGPLLTHFHVNSMRRKETERRVHTWTTLGQAFNTKPNTSFRRLIQNRTGLFDIKPLHEPEGFFLLKELAIEDTNRLVEECCSVNRTRKMVEVFDNLSDTLCQVADLAEFIRMAHPVGHFANAAEDACIAIGSLVEKLNTHKQLYDALKLVHEKGDKFPLSDVDQHVTKLFLFDFEQSGIHLDENQRSRVVHLNDSILTRGQYFMSRTVTPRSVPKDKLPPHVRQHFAKEGSNSIITGLHSEVSLEMAREAAYKIYLYPDNHQEMLLTEMLNSRHELATLCGFQSYAHRATRDSLSQTPDLVCNFLDDLTRELRPRAAEDFRHMSELKKSLFTESKALAPWDVPYLTSLTRQQRHNISNADLSQYFSLGAVMEGVGALVDRLYGVRLQVEETADGELWNTDVYKLAVIHEIDGLLGHIYCDFYERPGKAHQDCHFTIRGGKCLSDGTYQNPIVVLHLNLPYPSWSTPSLLTTGMVENLFHEMGHAMHSMLARTQYQHVTGTRCSTDFAEVPSVLMEFFALDPRVIQTYARHYKTGETIPEELVTKMVASKAVFGASELQLQTFYTKLDQRYHGSARWSGTTTTTHILEEVQNDYYELPYVPNTAWQLRFGHLVGYGAKYYSYLVSRAVASWIWQKYFAGDPFDSEMGRKYQHEVLSHGGGKPPHAIVEDFLGKQVSPISLVNALMNDFDSKK